MRPRFRLDLTWEGINLPRAASRMLAVLGIISIIAVYLGATCALLVSWNRKGFYAPSGDEPHYLVVAKAIARYHTVEVSSAFKDEFAHNRLGRQETNRAHKRWETRSFVDRKGCLASTTSVCRYYSL